MTCVYGTRMRLCRTCVVTCSKAVAAIRPYCRGPYVPAPVVGDQQPGDAGLSRIEAGSMVISRPVSDNDPAAAVRMLCASASSKWWSTPCASTMSNRRAPGLRARTSICANEGRGWCSRYRRRASCRYWRAVVESEGPHRGQVLEDFGRTASDIEDSIARLRADVRGSHFVPCAGNRETALNHL